MDPSAFGCLGLSPGAGGKPPGNFMFLRALSEGFALGTAGAEEKPCG